MLVSKQDNSALQVRYRSYRLGLLLLLLPPLMMFEHVPALIDGSLAPTDLAALLLGVLMPLLGAYLLIEIGSFSFSRPNNRFSFRWRNLLRSEALDLPLERVVSVRRDALEAGDSGYNYRLVVVLDDGRVVGLTRGYCGYHDRQLDRIVEQIREYLGHVVPLR